jgi:hypothetical protein
MMNRKSARRTAVATLSARKPYKLLADVRNLILATRAEAAQTVNAGLTMLYWHVGNRIRRDILQNKRAEYGADIVATVSRQLSKEFGRGFTEKNLKLREAVRLARARLTTGDN